LLHGVEDAELAWYYRHCAATIYPSRYEGWGLPVAESLGYGRLCLSSSATSMPEISRDLPEFFDPLDAHGLVALVERTLREPDWVRDREAEIRSKFEATPWTHTAGEVLVAVDMARAAKQDRRAA
jgi:glycosyltransferase involved in cell wall biosynthesis